MVEDTVTRLPLDWQPLFKWLAIDLHKAEIIYNDMMFSKYGSQPDWGDLLKSLIVEDPFIQGQKLLFKPRLLLLNDHLQNQFLCFLMKHSSRIPDVYLKQFVCTLSDHIQPSSAVYELLISLADKTKVEVTKVWEQDLNKKNVEITTAESPVTKSNDGPNQDTDVILIDEDDSSNSPDKPNINSEDMKQAAKRARSESSETDHAAKRIRLEETELRPPLAEIIVREIDLTNSNFESVNSENTQDNEVKICARQAENDMDIPEHVHKVAVSLKDIWMNDKGEPKSELAELTTFSVHEIESVCHIIEFSSLSEDSLCTVCEHVMSSWDSFSYAAGVSLLKYIILDKIDKLTEKVSRQFSQTITNLARQVPKQFIDGVMVPGFKSTSEISSFKSEIFMSIIQNSLSSDNRLHMLQQLFADPLKLTENVVILIQGALDNGCEFNDIVFQKLLENLLESGSEFSKNLKFGKFLLSLTNKHGKNFKSLELLERIINFHNTFFKKSLLTSLKKLRS